MIHKPTTGKADLMVMAGSAFTARFLAHRLLTSAKPCIPTVFAVFLMQHVDAVKWQALPTRQWHGAWTQKLQLS